MAVSAVVEGVDAVVDQSRPLIRQVLIAQVELLTAEGVVAVVEDADAVVDQSRPLIRQALIAQVELLTAKDVVAVVVVVAQINFSLVTSVSYI